MQVSPTCLWEQPAVPASSLALSLQPLKTLRFFATQWTINWMKQLRGYKPKKSRKLLLHLPVNRQYYPTFHCEPAGDSDLPAGLNSRDWNTLLSLFHFDCSIKRQRAFINKKKKKNQTSATPTRISQHFINITSPIAVIAVNVTPFAFRRDPIARRLQRLAQCHGKTVAGLGKVVFHLPYTLHSGAHSPHLPSSFLHFT